MSFKVPNDYRVKTGAFASDDEIGNNGLFIFERNKIVFRCIASDGMGWEHVSVSIEKRRCPTWEEMAMVKRMFWDDEDCVVQFHPPKSEYINNHQYVLHLWRKIGFEFPLPDSSMVGIKGVRLV